MNVQKSLYHIIFVGLIVCTLVSCEKLDEDIRVTLPVLEDSYPVVEVSVEGVLRRMLIDTGASATVLSSTLLETEDKSWQRISMLSIGNKMWFRDVWVYAWDTPFSQPGTNEINGYLGMDILRGLLVTFDHMQTVTFDISNNVCRGTSYFFDYDEFRRPFIGVAVDDHEIPNVLLDTGAKYSTLSRKTVEALDAYVQENAVETSLTTTHGHVGSGYFISTVKNYCVVDTCEENVAVHFPVWDAVGDTFFSRFTVTFDFPNRVLSFCGN